MDEALGLFELNEYVRRVIALNFEAPVWVRAELSQVKQSRGHYYLDLIEKEESSDKIKAQSSAVIWANTFWFLRKKLGDILFDILQDGMELKLKVYVDFHERYGMKLVVEDLDPSFSMGQLEIARRKILEQLKEERLLERNSLLPLPRVIQRLAILSAENAAGYQDFIKQLEENGYGYQFEFSLYPIAVQGDRVERDVVKALAEINSCQQDFDCIVIVRGGGARIDLAAFDNYAIGAAIANSSLPVVTGIGHDIDQTVTDLVANRFCKTPTAVADFLIEYNARFEALLMEREKILGRLGNIFLEGQRASLIRAQHWLELLPKTVFSEQGKTLQAQQNMLIQLGRSKLKEQSTRMQHMHAILRNLDPVNTLKRGYSITEDEEGNIITSPEGLRKGQSLKTKIAGGQIHSQITQIQEDD